MPKALSQRDPQWANKKLGTSNTTIHDYGCTLTSLTMLLNHYGGNYTPDQVNDKLKLVNGFSQGNLIVWSSIPKAFPQVKSVERVWSYDNAKVSSNLPALVEVNGSRIGASKHWVLYIGGQRMNDPWFGNEKATSYYAPTGCAIFNVEVIDSVEKPVDNSDLEACLSQHKILVDEAKIKDETIESLSQENEDRKDYVKKLEIELQTEKDNQKDYKNNVDSFLREMVTILDPHTVIEIADENLVKNLAKKVVSDFSEVQSQLVKKEREWAKTERSLEEENSELEKQVKSLKEELERLMKRVEQVETDVARNKEAKAENNKAKEFIDSIINLFKGK